MRIKTSTTNNQRSQQPGTRLCFKSLIGTIALALATPSLLAAPGGGKGKPGGGDDGGGDPPPPVDATYTYERIPGPDWAERYRVNNFNNFGGIVGEGLTKSRGRTVNVEGYVWKGGSPLILRPLAGGSASVPYDLSDDAAIVVGDSLGSGPDTLCAWIDFNGGGTYTPIDLQSVLLEAAAIHLPTWNFDSIEDGVVNGADNQSILSSDGNFLRAMGRFPLADGAPVSDFGIVDLVVQFDWSLLADPSSTPVLRMWVMDEPPGSDPSAPFLHGARINGWEIEIGVRSTLDPSPVVRMAAVRMGLVYDWDDYTEEPVVWEYDLVADIASVRRLATSPWFSTPRGINIYGAAVGADSVWDVAGNVSQLPITSADDPYNSVRGINSAGAVAGPAQNYDYGQAFLWTPETGLTDLKTATGGSLDLNVALDINDAGQILARGSAGWYVLTPIVP